MLRKCINEILLILEYFKMNTNDIVKDYSIIYNEK